MKIRVFIILLGPFLFLNCKETTQYENKAYFFDNTLVLELNYHDLPAKNRFTTIHGVYYDGRIISLNLDGESVVFEYKDAFLRIQIFNVDICPGGIVFAYGRRSSFNVYLDDIESGDIKVRVSK